MELLYYRNELSNYIKNIFQDRKIVNGFPINIKVEELPAIYVYLDNFTYVANTFNSFLVNAEFGIELLYSAKAEFDYRNRGIPNEERILIETLELVEKLYKFDIMLSSGAQTFVIEQISADPSLDREGIVRVSKITLRAHIIKEG